MKRPPGLTLLEMMVYAALFPLLLGVVYTILMASRRYLETARNAVDVQQSAALAVSKMGRELRETTPLVVQTFPGSAVPASTVVGVVFVSARNSAGQFVWEPGGSGLPYWQKYVAYYLDADPSDPGSNRMRALYRAEFTPTVSQGFPTLDPGLPSTLTPAVTASSIRSAPQNRRLICGRVLAPTTALPRGGLNVYFSSDAGVTRTYGACSNPVYLELTTYDERAGVASTTKDRPAYNQVQVSTAVVARR